MEGVCPEQILRPHTNTTARRARLLRRASEAWRVEIELFVYYYY